MRFFVFSILLSCFPLAAALIPTPREIQLGVGELKVDVQTAVIASKSLIVPAETLTAALQKTTGFVHRVLTPQQVGRTVMRGAVSLELVEMEEEESYLLEITAEGATIKGADLSGLMHGVQTFVQLLPVAKESFPRVMIPGQTIRDWPETRRRIFHLDVSQHLFPTDDLKDLVDWLSFHKINEFHLQLNGDAGWRMESFKFPKLHEVGSVRASTPPLGDPSGSDSTEYGGYYPQEKLRELAGYAEARGIDLIPSFTLVTGASALIAAYPELGNASAQVATTWEEPEERAVGVAQNEATLNFLEDFLAEVATVFSSRYVRLQGEGGEFHEQLREVLAKSKKGLFLPGDMARTDFSVYSRPADAELLLSVELMAEEGFNSLRQVYDLETGERAEARIRTRYTVEYGKLQYLVFPRIAAFAEATWVPAGKGEYEDFRTRADEMVSRYRAMGVQSSTPYDVPTGGVLGAAKVSGSLVGRANHEAEMIFDGRLDSFFWSEGGLKKGDYLTVEFPWAIGGDITVATGRSVRKGPMSPGMLEDGVLDLSADGVEWDAAAEFFDGVATVTVPVGTKFARIRVFTPQDEPLVINEVILSEPLLYLEYLEVRKARLPVTHKEISLTFEANFVENPEFREEIAVIRRTFFDEWLPLSIRLGLVHDVGTPRTFKVKPGEPGEMSDEEARDWMLKRLISRIQSYPVTAPLWFATGMKEMLMANFPEKADRSKSLEGGAQSAAFLAWVSQKYGEQVLMGVSQDCRKGTYQRSVWKLFTKKSLDELCLEFQGGH